MPVKRLGRSSRSSLFSGGFGDFARGQLLFLGSDFALELDLRFDRLDGAGRGSPQATTTDGSSETSNAASGDAKLHKPICILRLIGSSAVRPETGRCRVPPAACRYRAVAPRCYHELNSQENI
jgi:hypothetical protein